MMDDQDTIMITGAAGFLGAHYLRYVLTHTDWDVVCPVSFRHRGVPERIAWAVEDVGPPDDTAGRVNVVKCDLACPIADTTRYLFGDQVDHIVNFASESHIVRSIQDPVPFVQNNVNLMLYLLEYARSLPDLQSFIQISTDEVYGPAIAGAHKEWESIRPSTPYSASKAAQEALAIAYWDAYGLPLTIVNSMNPIGETQDPEKFVPLLIGKILRGENVKVHKSSDDVIGSRIYLHAEDLASAVHHILTELEPAVKTDVPYPDRWNVVGDTEINNLDLALLVASFIEDHGLSVELESTSVHASRYALNGQKLDVHGWRPKISLYDAVERTVRWTLMNPLWRDRALRSA